MILPQFNQPAPFDEPNMSEPGQATSLQDVIYRVSRGELTGIGQIPLEYGDDDEDDVFYNGMEVDRIDAFNDSIEFENKKKSVDNRIKFLKSKSTKVIKKTQDYSSDGSPAQP